MAPKTKKPVEADELMIVNDSPGEECRIAILQNSHLEELFTERVATATDVGNIYKGRVTNVEPAIQAAFVDYGQGANGFLHISDLHPKYFPGEERTERVGKKIPRRERPPIQAALRRGQEILVQVLKEGIGTKGPTLTSYLSIPGRLLVLMPDMDRVGVSRKVEDEEQRREMRQILDSLDLPDGFGFILRTAGYGKTKTELKRDAAYLMRLWKVMDKRIKSVGAPCELYTESDLLLRTVRDILRPSIKAIIVDSESAFERISMFLRVVTPRSAPKVVHYKRGTPIFHAFDVERQIELIHSREVPLASGGRLVIDQTEALVAIDVNSGRSRSARDSETNAYETNVEATDEICRQLRLRDLGGLIVNDLIDMRSAKHRRQIEELFEANLKKDRAKATALKISEFGILEMTRQRMRPSIRKSHFMACPHCAGHGEIRVPEYVASDAVRHAGFLLQFERVRRVELACSPRVASVLLSAKRRELVRMEDLTGKKIDVRVSDAIAIDRVDYYAYDDRASDIDITRLPPLKLPTLGELEAEQDKAPEIGSPEPDDQPQHAGRRRRRRSGPADAAAIALAGDFIDDFEDEEDEELEEAESGARLGEPSADDERSNRMDGEQGDSDKGGRRRRRRRRRKRGGGGGGGVNGAPSVDGQASAPASQGGQQEPEDAAAGADGAIDSSIAEESPESSGAGNGGRRRRRRRGRRRRNREGMPPDQNQGAHAIGADSSSGSLESDDAPEQDDAVESDGGLSALPAGDGEPEPSDAAREFVDDPESDEAAIESSSSADASTVDGQTEGSGRRKRRRRRRGRGKSEAAIEPDSDPVETANDAVVSDGEGDRLDGGNELADSPETDGDQAEAGGESTENEGKKRRSRRRRRGRKGGAASGDSNSGENDGESGASGSLTMPQPTENVNSQPTTRPSDKQAASTDAAPQTAGAGGSPAKKPRRALYRAGRGSVSTSARDSAVNRDE